MQLNLPAFLLAVCAASGAVASCPDPKSSDRVDVYPTAAELPENLLRFYIYFPRPMGQDDILKHIAIMDDTGATVEGALLSNRFDLWSPNRQRLTLLLDPGRVKTGLEAHETLGRALEPGRRYTLSIRGAALDFDGCQLGVETAHSFSVGPADLEPPAPAGWALSVPPAGTLEPLAVDLGSPHDHLSLAYRLRVRDSKGDIVPGAIELGQAETVWRFVPKRPWAAAPHHVWIDERLEDLAGNRPGALFDRPLSSSAKGWANEIPFQPIPTAP
ncbi:MAG: hypothetical protein AAGF74_06890 [Pseudomonadota bacterium]